MWLRQAALKNATPLPPRHQLRVTFPAAPPPPTNPPKKLCARIPSPPHPPVRSKRRKPTALVTIFLVPRSARHQKQNHSWPGQGTPTTDNVLECWACFRTSTVWSARKWRASEKLIFYATYAVKAIKRVFFLSLPNSVERALLDPLPHVACGSIIYLLVNIKLQVILDLIAFCWSNFFFFSLFPYLPLISVFQKKHTQI